MSSEPRFFNPRSELDVRERRLPHWSQDAVAVFVTWRLRDALPVDLQAKWRAERDQWIRLHPKPWDAATEIAYHSEFSERIEALLDAGAGSCALRAGEVRAIVEATLQHHDTVEYVLHAYVVMPNHVHVLFSPKAGKAWEVIVATWKSVSAHRINRHLVRRGALWQEEVWDRLIRHPGHYAATGKYIRENPVRAGLKSEGFTLFERAAR